MSKKLTYTNRQGDRYYFRTVSGKRGTQIVCSQTESPNDLHAIPETHEIVENPNGQVSCRKKRVSDISPKEIALTNKLCSKLIKEDVRVVVEVKKRQLIIHSASTTDMKEVLKLAWVLPSERNEIQEIVEKNIRFDPVFKLELTDKKSRTFSAYRMCWSGDCDWMFLDSGQLDKLVKALAPHIEQESFFELF